MPERPDIRPTAPVAAALRYRQCAAHALARLFLPAVVLLGAQPSAASPPPSARAELDGAYADLDALARRARQAGGLPRWSDPEAARVLARLWNKPTILGAPPYKAVDLPLLLDIGARQNAVYKTYLLFAPQLDTLPDTAANTTRYQDEITRATAAMLQVQAAQVEALGAFWASLPTGERTPVRREGAQRMRAGLVEFLTGVLISLRLPTLRADNRRILVDALAETAGPLGAGLPLSDRTALTAQVAAAGAALPADERERVTALASTFAGRDCTSLCAIE